MFLLILQYFSKCDLHKIQMQKYAFQIQILAVGPYVSDVTPKTKQRSKCFLFKIMLRDLKLIAKHVYVNNINTKHNKVISFLSSGYLLEPTNLIIVRV